MSESKLLKLPAITKFLTEISEDLENGVNSIVFMPFKVTNKIFDTLKYILREESNCEILRVELNCKKPLDLIFDRFIKNPDLIKNSNSLIDNINVSKYLFLNLCDVSSDLSQLWFDFLSEYSIRCTSKDRSQRLKFCFIVDKSSASCTFPEKSPALSHNLFYNYLSEIDFHFCLEGIDELLEPMDYELFKSLLYELAFPDLDLIYHLINDIKGFISNPIEKIKSYYTFNEKINLIIVENQNNLFKEIRFKENLTINHKLFKLWLIGLIRYRGKEFHPSTIALLAAQKEKSLKSREWFAQLKILFPLIEKNRIKIAEWILENINSKICKKYLEEFQESEIINLEIGKLHHILLNSRGAELKITELAAICRSIRNNLAHRNPVKDLEIKEFATKAKIASIVNENAC